MENESKEYQPKEYKMVLVMQKKPMWCNETDVRFSARGVEIFNLTEAQRVNLGHVGLDYPSVWIPYSNISHIVPAPQI